MYRYNLISVFLWLVLLLAYPLLLFVDVVLSFPAFPPALEPNTPPMVAPAITTTITMSPMMDFVLILNPWQMRIPFI